MADKIKTGTILITEDACLPPSLRFESEPCSKGWRLVKNLDGYGLDRRIRQAGWTFVRMAGEIKATALGFDRHKTACRAVNRGLAKLKPERFNCLEITQVTLKGFLGLRHVIVSARRRLIQQSLFLFRAKDPAGWERAKLAVA